MHVTDDMDRLLDDALAARVGRGGFLRRAAALGFSLPAAASLFAVCGSHVAAQGAAKGGGAVEILVGFGTGNGPDQIPIQQQIATRLMAANHSLAIRFNRVLDSDVANQKLTLQIAAGHPPQVIMPSGLYGINLFVDKGVWQDLSPRLHAEGLKLDNLFLPAAVAGARGAGYYGPGSTHVVAIPAVMHGHFIGINEDLFKKAGVRVPTYGWDDQSWDYQKMLEVAMATTLDSNGHRAGTRGFDHKNITQYGLARFDADILERGFGAIFPYNPATKKPGFGTPEYIAGFQMAADLQNKYHVVPDDAAAAALSGATGSQDSRQMAWLSGKMAMAELCTCDLPTWGAVKSFKWSVVAIPRGPKRRFSYLNLDYGAVVAAGKHNGNVDGAWQVLKGYLLDPGNERQFSYDSLRGIPALKSNAHVFGDAVKRDYPTLNHTVITESATHGATDAEAWHPAYTQIDSATGPFFDKVMSGQMTAAQAAPLMQKAAQKAVDDWFATNKLPTG